MTIGTNHKDLKNRLTLYSGIAGALVAGSAHAVPTESTSADLPLTIEDTTDDFDSAGASFDVDGDGVDDFNGTVVFRTDCMYNDGYAYLSNDVGNGYMASSGPFYYAGMVSPGTNISGASDWDSSFRYFFGCTDGDSEGEEFPVASRGFVGIRFERNAGADTHYGYMDVETFAGSVGVTVHSVCFESEPDTAIEVGACFPARIAPVPVGGLIPLSLGVLALGGMALRRRKTQH